MFKQLTASLIALTALSGCASILSGSTQEIQLKTNPPSQVKCEAQNERGHYTSNDKPGLLLVKRSQSRLNIDCAGDEYVGKYSEQAGAEAWVFGNALLGGLIGLTIDGITGSMFSYDEALTIPVATKEVAAQRGIPVGGKQDKPQAQPAIAGGAAPAQTAPAETQPEAAAEPVAQSTTTATTTTTTATVTDSQPVVAEPQAAKPARLMSYDELVRSGAIVEAPKAQPVPPNPRVY